MKCSSWMNAIVIVAVVVVAAKHTLIVLYANEPNRILQESISFYSWLCVISIEFFFSPSPSLSLSAFLVFSSSVALETRKILWFIARRYIKCDMGRQQIRFLFSLFTTPNSIQERFSSKIPHRNDKCVHVSDYDTVVRCNDVFFLLRNGFSLQIAQFV